MLKKPSITFMGTLVLSFTLRKRRLKNDFFDYEFYFPDEQQRKKPD